VRYKNELTSSIIQSENRFEIFDKLPTNKKGFLLLKLPKPIREELLKKSDDKSIIKFVDYLDHDEATDLLQSMEIKRRKKIIQELSKEVKEKVEYLLKFDENTIARLVNFDFIEVNKNYSFGKVSKIIGKHERRTGKVPTVLVTEEGFLVGEFSPHLLGLKNKTERIKNHIKKIPHVKITTKEEDLLKIFRKHPHNKVVVLDEDDSILGIIYTDDMLNILEKHSQDNLYGFTGLSKEEDVFDSPFEKVKHRYKWLIINLFTVFLAAGVISLFQETVNSLTLIAIYLPVVAGMGGNTGTQTLAIMVRGLALKEIELKNSKKVLINETIAGGFNGLINGLIVAIVITFWNKNFIFGIVVGLAMIFSLMIAGFFGGIIPLIMKKLGKDPATSATIFITTATDVFGFLVYLGLATIML
jgi:magnesium transporter